MNKIQVGANVWIKPKLGQDVPKLGRRFFVVASDGAAIAQVWQDAVFDYLALNCGNFFSSPTEAEAAIIKPVDTTPITYEQWVDAGKPHVHISEGFDTVGAINVCRCYKKKTHQRLFFSLHKAWLTRESAQAWLDKWHAENGSAE